MNMPSIFGDILKIIFPPLCLHCKEKIEKGVLCESCGKNVEILNAFYCPKCNRRLIEPRNNCHPKMRLILAAPTSYKNETVQELIHALKYNRIKVVLEFLKEVLKAYLRKINAALPSVVKNSIIIPIPLYPKKERERGFNQAYLLAELVAEILHNRVAPKLEIETNNLIRTKNTKSQTEVGDYEKRKLNIASCFTVNYPERIAGKNIILVDDVFTSGATMREAVRVLKVAGARKIVGFVIAKT